MSKWKTKTCETCDLRKGDYCYATPRIFPVGHDTRVQQRDESWEFGHIFKAACAMWQERKKGGDNDG